MNRIKIHLFVSLFAAVSLYTSHVQAQQPSEAKVQDEKTLQSIELSTGQVLEGYVTDTGTEYDVELVDGQRITLPHSAVRSVKTASQTPQGEGPQTERTRYLYSPSAMMLEAGEGYVSQKELIITAFAYGITDNLSVDFAFLLPIVSLAFGDFEIPAALGLRFGGSPTDWFHTSMGVQVVGLPTSAFSTFEDGYELFLMPFGNVTLGGPDASITLNAALPISGDDFAPASFITTVSAAYMFNDSVGIVTEHVIGAGFDRDPRRVTWGPALAARFMPSDFTIDAGLVYALDFEDGEMNASGFPLPWLDAAWNF